LERSPKTEINCSICRKPIVLETDLCTDANGKSVHEECYVKGLTQDKLNPRKTEIPPRHTSSI